MNVVHSGFLGDTWLGKLGNNGREQPKLINNSLGIMSPSNDQRSISFAWDDRDAKQPRRCLRPESDKHWYWPFTGIAHEQRITLFAMVMEKTKHREHLVSSKLVPIC